MYDQKSQKMTLKVLKLVTQLKNKPKKVNLLFKTQLTPKNTQKSKFHEQFIYKSTK